MAELFNSPKELLPVFALLPVFVREGENIDEISERLAKNKAQTASDAVLKRMEPQQLHDLLTEVSKNPRVYHLDPMTILLWKNFDTLSKATAELKQVDFEIPARRTLKMVAAEDVPNGLKLPVGTEDNLMMGRSQLQAALKEMGKFLLLRKLLGTYDEGDAPEFFDSIEEAAAHFELSLRPLLKACLTPSLEDESSTPTAGTFVPALHADGGVGALCFAGLGSFWLESADAALDPDTGWTGVFERLFATRPAMVVDLRKAYGKTKPGYEPYGAAIFFDANRNELGVWLKARSKLVLPTDADYAYAVWVFKCSLFSYTYAYPHLADAHWMASNSLVQALATCVEPTHPLRRRGPRARRAPGCRRSCRRLWSPTGHGSLGRQT